MYTSKYAYLDIGTYMYTSKNISKYTCIQYTYTYSYKSAYTSTFKST